MKAKLIASMAAMCMAFGIGGGIFLEARTAEAAAPCTITQWQYYKCVGGVCKHADQYCYCKSTDPMKNKTIYAGCSSNPGSFCSVFGASCTIGLCSPSICNSPPPG